MKTQTITRNPPTPCKTTARVFLAGGLNVMSAPGGGEVQMTATASALAKIGLRAKLWRPWEHKLAEGDCLHLFGSLPEHIPTIDAARRQGVRVVLSTIAWFDLASYWREPGRLSRRLGAACRYVLRANWPSLPSWRRSLYHSVDMLLPNSSSEADQLMRLFQVPARRIHVVPNGADPRFAIADAGQFERKYGLRDFVLSIGRIEPRKNQLGLIRALKDTDMPLVVVGQPVPGHMAYHEACLREAGSNVHFVGHINHDAPMLASAYGACRCLALTSWFETPGLVALEAAMSGVPLVLPRGGSGHEYFGNQALYVGPKNLEEIREAVRAAFKMERNEHLARRVQKQFTWESVARITRRAYEKQGNP
ncbi:MAG: glycosyltransferase [Pirellulales bacterium]|nr:glycosyltransferase [Pirellulales bacterium]